MPCSDAHVSCCVYMMITGLEMCETAHFKCEMGMQNAWNRVNTNGVGNVFISGINQ